MINQILNGWIRGWLKIIQQQRLNFFYYYKHICMFNELFMKREVDVANGTFFLFHIYPICPVYKTFFFA